MLTLNPDHANEHVRTCGNCWNDRPSDVTGDCVACGFTMSDETIESAYGEPSE